MLPTPKNYSILPAVVPANEETLMTIVPNEKAFLLFENETYTVTIIPVNGDETSYYQPTLQVTVEAVARDGVLRFPYTFEGEQEHVVILRYGEKELQKMAVFSAEADLYALYPLKGDLHAHSYRSDGKRDPSAEAGHYREQGYDFFALTDHNRYFPGGEIDETFSDINTGFIRIRGEEVHTPGSVVHIVHVGGKTSVTDQYCSNREQYEKDVAELEKQVPANVPDKYRTRYAMAMWATAKIHEAEGLAIFVHPYWRPGKSMVHNVTDEFARILMMSGMFDAYELVGGMGQPGNNRSIALWGELRLEGFKLPVVGSSDVHGFEKSSTFPHLFTIAFAEGDSHDAIIDAIRKGNTVAVEATGNEYERHFRCYGSLRLVTYAQFLLQHYFPEHQRLCHGEGVAMRAYAMEDCFGVLVEMQRVLVNNHANRFFGRTEPLLPSKEIIAFENKWREIQLNGPVTKGSSIDPPVTRQI